MNNCSSIDHKNSVRQVSKRLYVTLLRAYILVSLVMVLFMLISTYLLLHNVSNDAMMAQPPFSEYYKAYYIGHGCWEGVDSLLPIQSHSPPDNSHLEWENYLLLDSKGRILVEHGDTGGYSVGEIYIIDEGETISPIIVNGIPVGTLVFLTMKQNSPFNQFAPLFAPVSMIMASLAILTVVIGVFLTRRVVAPLAEVISAAQSVTAGNLSSRVNVSGPDDMRALSDSFNQMAYALELNNQERREMLADIAHELRTPLSIIRGRLEGMVDGVYPAGRAQVIPVLEEIKLLERLIEDLHVLTLAESRRLNVHYQPVHLERLAKRVTDLFQANANERGVLLKIEAQPHLPMVQADLLRTEQVISNLVGNALRYVPSGGNILIKVKQAPGSVSLTVNDNGAGLSDADLPYIFERFWRSEKSRSRSSGGAGLGLTIARQLIETQGGRIWACNLLEGGFQVGFTLPVHLDSAA